MTPHDHRDAGSTDAGSADTSAVADADADADAASGSGCSAEHDGQPGQARSGHLTAVTSPNPRGALEAMRAGGGAGHCRFPGCTRRRQPRLNRRGAPPAYCTDPGHHPDGARRERIRRRRRGLPLEAILDEHDQPLPAVSSLPPDDPAAERAEHAEGAERAEEDERAELPGGSGPSWAASVGSAVGPELTVVFPLDRAPEGGVVVNPAEHARRLADQLALAATAYEQVAEQTAELQAANIELTRRLAATSSLSTDSSTDPSTDPGPRPGSSASPDPATDPGAEHDS